MTAYKLPHNINAALEGRADIEVPFVREVIDVFGRKVEGVFPRFNPITEIILDEYYDSREFYDNNVSTCYRKQMEQASKQFAAQIQANPSLAAKLGLNDKQVADIKAGSSKPEGLTWHHHQHRRKMQLVDYALHHKYLHTGGSYTWNEQHFKEAYPDW